MRLLSCPFCRQLFRTGETDGACPECGVELVRMEKLPLSLEAQTEEQAGLPEAGQEPRLGLGHLAHGRGALLGVALAGLVAFFLPWLEVKSPFDETWSGFELARHRLGWLWAGAVGWFITLPLLLSRRSVSQLRGIRAISFVFAALTPCETLVLLLVPPRPGRLVPLDYSWQVGFYLSGLLGLVGMMIALQLGGRVEARVTEEPSPGELPGPSESGPGPTLH